MNASASSLTNGESPIRGSAAFRQAILSWYDAHGRDLPWRVKGGARADPYRVWLSEIMLQQTTVAAVAPYFTQFVERWPTVAALAAADDGAVMQAWAGLGYYSRARNLIAAARVVTQSGWPETEAGLRALPGVGAYTAAAIAAIAFGEAVNVVDGNIERVMARLFRIEAPLPGAKPALKAAAATLVGPERPGDYAQALMDLGATVCTPRAPKCLVCPVSTFCDARAVGVAEALPAKAKRPDRPKRYGVAFVLTQGVRAFVVRRPNQGLLGGMIALPTTDWGDAPCTEDEAQAAAPTAGAWRDVGAITHVFTHFALELRVWTAVVEAGAPIGGEWRALDGLDSVMPTVFAKALRRAVG